MINLISSSYDELYERFMKESKENYYLEILREKKKIN